MEVLAESELVSGNMSFHHFRPGTTGIPNEKLVRYFDEKVTPYRAKELFAKYLKVPSRIASYNFNPYFEGTHQIYHGRNDEVHYLNVEVGNKYPSKKNKLSIRRKSRKKQTKVSEMKFTVRKKG